MLTKCLLLPSMMTYNKLVEVKMRKIATCSFFGHRNAKLTDEQNEELKRIIEDLVVKHNINI